MPELPEVEITTQHLASLINQHQVAALQINATFRSLITVSPQKYLHQKIHRIDRRGKSIILHIGNNFILLHLGMSGAVFSNQDTQLAAKHIIFKLVTVQQAAFIVYDPRKFGYIWLTQGSPLDKLNAQYGPEPLTDSFSSKYLRAILQKRKANIKAMLMDNKVVVGIGNIYANEILFKSLIHPLTSCNTITKEQFATIVQASKVVLADAIRHGGTSFKDWKNPLRKQEGNKKYLLVYQKQECSKCGSTINKIIIRGRSSFFCTQCQKI